jgi:membrane protein implicated in regulation of membrane protease activity
MNELFLFDSVSLVYLWLIIAIVFLFAELGTPGLFFFVAFAVGSCFAALFAYMQYSLVMQCIVAIVCSGVAFLILRHYFTITWKMRIKTNVEALVGQTGVVVKTIKEHNSGLVKIGGEVWTAMVQNGVILHEGTVVEIVEVKGNKLVVTSLTSSG